MPLNYAIALNEIGSETVHEYVGQEPSGRKHNELDLDYNSKITFLSYWPVQYHHRNSHRRRAIQSYVGKYTVFLQNLAHYCGRRN